MVRLTKEEVWALNTLNSSAAKAREESQRATASVSAYIKLLEIKYNAIFDPNSGELKPKG